MDWHTDKQCLWKCDFFLIQCGPFAMDVRVWVHQATYWDGGDKNYWNITSHTGWNKWLSMSNEMNLGHWVKDGVILNQVIHMFNDFPDMLPQC